MATRERLVVIALLLVHCLAADVPRLDDGDRAGSFAGAGQHADGAAAAAGDNAPWAVIIYNHEFTAFGGKDKEKLFSLELLNNIVGLFIQQLRVPVDHIIIFTNSDLNPTHRGAQNAYTRLVSDNNLANIPPRNYYSSLAVCDIMWVVAGRRDKLRKATAVVPQTHGPLYVLISAHGSHLSGRHLAEGFVRGYLKPEHSTNTYLAGGSLEFAFSPTKASAECPRKADAVRMTMDWEHMQWALQAARTGAPHRHIYVIVDSCQSASFFQTEVQRLDEAKTQKADPRLAEEKAALFDEALALPDTLILTSASDITFSADNRFIRAMFFLMRTADASTTWGQLVTRMKEMSRQNSAQSKRQRQEQGPPGVRAFNDAKEYTIRAFGARAMLAEPLLPPQ